MASRAREDYEDCDDIYRLQYVHAADVCNYHRFRWPSTAQYQGSEDGADGGQVCAGVASKRHRAAHTITRNQVRQTNDTPEPCPSEEMEVSHGVNQAGSSEWCHTPPVTPVAHPPGRTSFRNLAGAVLVQMR